MAENVYQCPIDLPPSCELSPWSNTDADSSISCCSEGNNGLIVQTQFWTGTDPRKLSNLGPSVFGNQRVFGVAPLDDHDHDNNNGVKSKKNGFVIHGLWPDKCIGVDFDAFCEQELFIDDVFHLLTDNPDTEDAEARLELYNEMTLLWPNSYRPGQDELLWIHEFNKHGTCMKTIRPECYGGDRKKAIVDYFNVTVNLFKKLDSFTSLENQGIVPSYSRSYSKSEIENALSIGFGGKRVFIDCDPKTNALREVWYFNHIKGPLTRQQFVPVGIDELVKSPKSKCRDSGIWYYPKLG